MHVCYIHLKKFLKNLRIKVMAIIKKCHSDMKIWQPMISFTHLGGAYLVKAFIQSIVQNDEACLLKDLQQSYKLKLKETWAFAHSIHEAN